MMLWNGIVHLLLLALCEGMAIISSKALKLESELLSRLTSKEGTNMRTLSPIISQLEAEVGIRRPINSPVLDGVWRLLYTGNDIKENASPIQRTVTSLQQVKIYQVVRIQNRCDSFLRNSIEDGLPEVSNVVCFGDFRLRVTALASTVHSSSTNSI